MLCGSFQKLRAFADAIEDLSLGDELAGHGNTETAAGLRTMADNFQATEGEQGEALGGRVGATAQIPVILRTGRAAVKALNAIFHKVYKSNAERLTAWKTVSRVQREGGGNGANEGGGGTGGNGGGANPPPAP